MEVAKAQNWAAEPQGKKIQALHLVNATLFIFICLSVWFYYVFIVFPVLDAIFICVS
jgi:hypothetical protein